MELMELESGQGFERGRRGRKMDPDSRASAAAVTSPAEHGIGIQLLLRSCLVVKFFHKFRKILQHF